MPIIPCPTCGDLPRKLVAGCLTCNNTGRILVGPPGSFGRPSSDESGIREDSCGDPVGNALIALHCAMRATGVLVTLHTRPVPGEPLAQGRLQLCASFRNANVNQPFPQLFVELTPPSV